MTETLVPVFDIGNVFVDWNPMYLFRKLFETEEDAAWFHETVCTMEWHMEFDAGHIFSEGVAKLVSRYPRYWREITAYDTRWDETIAGIIEGTVAIHDELVAAEIPTFAITNFSWEKWMAMLPRWPFMEKFDGVVVSGLERVLKPDPRIFRLFCERYGLAPESCVFIDDNEANVVSARQVGMAAIHFSTPEALRAELISYGLPLEG